MQVTAAEQGRVGERHCQDLAHMSGGEDIILVWRLLEMFPILKGHSLIFGVAFPSCWGTLQETEFNKECSNSGPF